MVRLLVPIELYQHSSFRICIFDGQKRIERAKIDPPVGNCGRGRNRLVDMVARQNLEFRARLDHGHNAVARCQVYLAVAVHGRSSVALRMGAFLVILAACLGIRQISTPFSRHR